jgi:2-dehydro-3-deoxyglucarate aldolase
MNSAGILLRSNKRRNMGQTRKLLKDNKPALGAWMMIGHPTVAEIFAGEGFDWIGLDMEHTAGDLRALHEVALAVKNTGCDLFVRLGSCDPVEAKKALDAGANGIIVPLVNTPEQARQAVAMAKFPPDGVRGASFSRASDFGRNFADYFASHNDRVMVVVMLEHIQAVEQVDAILDVPGITATFIGPYDLSASMGRAGQLDHPDVQAAQKTLLDACRRHNVPAGFHVVSLDPALLQRRIEEGYRFLACSLDTEMLIHASRQMLSGIRR